MADAALETATEQDAQVIGSETDEHESLAVIYSRLVSSAMNDVRSNVRNLTRLVRINQLPAGNFFCQIELAPFHDLDDQIPPSVKDQTN